MQANIQSLKRVKEVQLPDGPKIKISTLTVDQVEEYIAPLEQIELQRGAGKIRAYAVICHGLNNALDEDVPAEQYWTAEKLRKAIDLPMFEFLQKEILAFSGFQVDEASMKAEENKVDLPGESSAASGKASSQSVPENSSVVSISGTSAAAS